MPKLAATLASLLLIASSIGVNIARYPEVGRLADPRTVAAAEPANWPQATSQPAPAETANADHQPPRTESAAQVAEQSPLAQQQPPGTFPTIHTERPVLLAQPDVAVPIVDVRPMVPVTNLTANERPAPTANGVRRLPPVYSAEATAVEFGSTRGIDASAYPATSTP